MQSQNDRQKNLTTHDKFKSDLYPSRLAAYDESRTNSVYEMRSQKHRTDSDYSVVHKPLGSSKDVHVSFEHERVNPKDHFDHRKNSLPHQLSHVNEREEGSDDEAPS